jgi:hypothetical protein
MNNLTAHQKQTVKMSPFSTRKKCKSFYRCFIRRARLYFCGLWYLRVTPAFDGVLHKSVEPTTQSGFWCGNDLYGFCLCGLIMIKGDEMLSLNDSYSFFRKAHRANEDFKGRFNVVNECLKNFGIDGNMCVKGMCLEEAENGDILVNIFKNRYVFTYSFFIKENIFLGQINLFKVTEIKNKEFEFLESAAFDDTGIIDRADVLDNPIYIDDELAVSELLLNMLIKALNHNNTV